MDKLETSPAALGAAMSVMDAIHGRRSVRAYSPRAVTRAEIEALLDAAVQAPSAMNEQPWAFAVVQDRETLRRLSESAKATLPAFRHFTPPENVFYDAGTLIVIYGKPDGPFAAADCWLAAENLMLAARALGLGSCVVGLATEALDAPGWKAELDVPAGLTAYAPIIVGEPAGPAPHPGRRRPRVLSWKRRGRH